MNNNKKNTAAKVETTNTEATAQKMTLAERRAQVKAANGGKTRKAGTPVNPVEKVTTRVANLETGIENAKTKYENHPKSAAATLAKYTEEYGEMPDIQGVLELAQTPVEPGSAEEKALIDQLDLAERHHIQRLMTEQWRVHKVRIKTAELAVAKAQLAGDAKALEAAVKEQVAANKAYLEENLEGGLLLVGPAGHREQTRAQSQAKAARKVVEDPAGTLKKAQKEMEAVQKAKAKPAKPEAKAEKKQPEAKAPVKQEEKQDQKK